MALLADKLFVMKIKPLLAALLLMMSSSLALAADTQFLQGLGDTQYRHIASKHVGRGYHIYVSLPDGYEESEETYPTLYVLDGGELFPMLTSYHRYLSFGEGLPKAIIVGISYGSDNFENGNFRSTDFTAPSNERDFWGGAARFTKFLSDELFPIIETEYRSESDRRIVFGHSIGGQFVLFAAQNHPGLFWGGIASNAALHRNLDFYLQPPPKIDGDRQTRLFVGNATNDDPRFLEPRARWIEYWTNQQQKPWELRVANLEGHTHMSAPPAAYREGMRWLFE
jgi:predicted alpha/beta superfamily hydrolase